MAGQGQGRKRRPTGKRLVKLLDPLVLLDDLKDLLLLLLPEFRAQTFLSERSGWRRTRVA